MLKDLRDRAYEVRRASLVWTSVIEALGRDAAFSDVARDVAEESFEIRARAPLYLPTEPFEDFDAALAYLLTTAEGIRQGIRADAKAVGRDFASALPRSRNTVEILREIATALTLLLKKEDDKIV